jgi:hypothetical protein
MARKKTDIRLVVRSEVNKAIRDLERTEKGIDKTSKAGGRATPIFSKLGGVVAGFIAALSVRQMVNFALEVTKLADSAEQVLDPFEKLVTAAGKDVPTALGILRKAVRDTISDVELMQIASRAMDAFTASGIKPEEAFEAVQKTMEFLFRYSVKFGKDFNQLMQTVFTGLQRGSALFLDDVGIMIDQTDKQFKGLDAIAKKAKIVEVALEQMAQKNKILGEVTEGTNVQVMQAGAAFDNLSVEIGKLLNEPTAGVLGELTKFLREFNEHIQLQNTIANVDRLNAIQKEKDVIEGLQAEYERLAKVIQGEIKEDPEEAIRARFKIDLKLNEIGRDRLAKLKEEEKTLLDIISGEYGREQIVKNINKDTGNTVDNLKAVRQEIKRITENYEGAQKLIKESGERISKEILDNAEKTIKYYKNLNEERVRLDQEQIDMVRQLSETSLTDAIAVSDYLLEHWEFTEEEKKRLLELRKMLIQDAADYEIAEAKRVASAITGIMGWPMQRMIEDMLVGTKKGKDIWSDFIDHLQSELTRFIASQAVDQFFKFFSDMFSGGSSGGGGGFFEDIASFLPLLFLLGGGPKNPGIGISPPPDQITLPRLSTNMPAPSFMQPGTISNISTDNSHKIDMGNFQVVVNGPVYGEDATLLNAVKKLQQEHQHRLGRSLNKPIL